MERDVKEDVEWRSKPVAPQKSDSGRLQDGSASQEPILIRRIDTALSRAIGETPSSSGCPRLHSKEAVKPTLKVTLLRTLACLGVVWGDLGTSPLYTISAIYQCEHECMTPTKDDIYGVVSFIFWAFHFIVILKYLCTVMTCDYHGEGGIFATLNTIKNSSVKKPTIFQVELYSILATIGAGAMMGDALITPALSVISAVEGLRSDQLFGDQVSVVSQLVVPITIILLLALYACQFYGTSKVGVVFGPVMLVWFLANAAIGIYNIAATGSLDIFNAWSPYYLVKFWYSGQFSGVMAFKAVGSVALCVSGAEALYADLGHFGKPPVYISTLAVVYPSLMIAYTGQAAYLTMNPTTAAVDRLFWNCVPNDVYIPMLVLATLATIIASQAMITGCFALVNQAIALELFPRVKILNTDSSQKDQVFVPSMNVILCIGTVSLVAGFQSSSALAGAYGLAVFLTFLADSCLVAAVFYHCHFPRLHWSVALLMASPFMAVDALFFSSSLYYKFLVGGWFPLSFGIIVSTLMFCWRFGRIASAKAYQKLKDDQPKDYLRSASGLVNALNSGILQKSPVTAVFVTASTIDSLRKGGDLPAALALFVRATGCVPRRTIVLTVRFDKNRAFIAKEDRILSYRVAEGLHSLVFQFGFAEPLTDLGVSTMVQNCLPELDWMSGNNAGDETLWYYVHREEVVPSKSRGVVGKLATLVYSGLLSVTSDIARFYQLPLDNIVQMGDVLRI